MLFVVDLVIAKARSYDTEEPQGPSANINNIPKSQNVKMKFVENKNRLVK